MSAMRQKLKHVSMMTLVVFVLSILPGAVTSHAQAAQFDRYELAGTVGGAALAATLALVAGPFGIAAAGLVGGAAGAMALGVGAERLFFQNAAQSNKERTILWISALGFAIGAPLLGMAAVAAPALGVLSAAIAGGVIGMQLGQRVNEPVRPPAVAPGEMVPVPPPYWDSGSRAAPSRERGEAGAKLAELQRRVDEARLALRQVIEQPGPARAQAHRALAEAEAALRQAEEALLGR